MALFFLNPEGRCEGVALELISFAVLHGHVVWCRCSSSGPCTHVDVVTEEDLEAFMLKLNESEDMMTGAPTWSLLMSKKAEGMAYTAWRRDPQVADTRSSFLS